MISLHVLKKLSTENEFESPGSDRIFPLVWNNCFEVPDQLGFGRQVTE